MLKTTIVGLMLCALTSCGRACTLNKYSGTSSLPLILLLSHSALAVRRSHDLRVYTMAQLQRRSDRLRSVLAGLKLPAHTTFTAYGTKYLLPLRSCDNRVNACHISNHELAYLAGFFDGDGCVRATTDLSGFTLQIGQCADNGEALLKFQAAFGGVIYRSRIAQGSQRAVIVWAVGGKLAKQAATLLSSVPSAKRIQLRIAAEGMPSCRSARQNVDKELKRLKHEEPPGFAVESWSYVAGFFDAEGYIGVQVVRPQLVLEVSQKFEAVLSSLGEFIARQLGGQYCKVLTWGSKQTSRLQIGRTAVSKRVLMHLLDAGLVVKRPSAVIATSTIFTSENHFQTRDAMSKLSGNQSRYRRLDAAGCRRSHAIWATQQDKYRLLRLGNTRSAHELDQKIAQMKGAHLHHNKEAVLTRLRGDIRAMLSHGAMRGVALGRV